MIVFHRFQVQNSRPSVLFGDLRDRLDSGDCLMARAPMPVPSKLDLYVAGFPCKEHL